MEAKREYFSHRKIPPSSDGYEARVFLPSKNPPFERWVWSASISPIEKSPQKSDGSKARVFLPSKNPKSDGSKARVFLPSIVNWEFICSHSASWGGPKFEIYFHRWEHIFIPPKNPPKSDGRKTRDFLPVCGWTKKLLTHNFCFCWNFEHRIGETAWPETKKLTLMCEKVTCTAPPQGTHTLSSCTNTALHANHISRNS